KLDEALEQKAATNVRYFQEGTSSVVSCGWARPGTRKKSEQFSRSFARRAPENISLSTGAREPSAPSSPKSSPRAFSSNQATFLCPLTPNDLPILDQRGGSGAYSFLVA